MDRCRWVGDCMRIDAFNKISQVYNANKPKNTSRAKSESFSDKLELSRTGMGYHAAKQVVQRTPDIREDKLAEIKQRMEAGSYNISLNEVADKLVQKYFD